MLSRAKHPESDAITHQIRRTELNGADDRIEEGTLELMHWGRNEYTDCATHQWHDVHGEVWSQQNIPGWSVARYFLQ